MHPILFQRGYLKYRSHPSTRSNLPAKKEGLLRRWLQIAAERRTRRKSIATLNALDDRMLRDIGIPRNSIERVVDNLCGVDARISALRTTSTEWHRGQSRLKLDS